MEWPFNTGEVEFKVADQLGNHGPAQLVIGVQTYAFVNRQFALFNEPVVLVQCLDVLDVGVTDFANGSDA